MGAMEVPDLSRATLSKLNEQQYLLLQELERTKRRLHEEIRAREEGLHEPQGNSSYSSPPPTSPTFRKVTGQTIVSLSSTVSPKTKHKRVLTNRSITHGQGHQGGRRGVSVGLHGLKRSRSEAGMSEVKGEAGTMTVGTQRPDSGDERSSTTTRIDMLPVMSSTGEAALEVGLAPVPAGDRGSTAQAVHMLPVFRLPTVSKAPVGGFLRRIPREETQKEKDCRAREEAEIEKMKEVLGLTDRQLAVLEEEFFPDKMKKYGRTMTMTAHRSLRGLTSKDGAVVVGAGGSVNGDGGEEDDLDIDRVSYDTLTRTGKIHSKPSGRHSSPLDVDASSNSMGTGGKRRRRVVAGHPTSDRQGIWTERDQHRHRRRVGGLDTSLIHKPRGRNSRQDPHDDDDDEAIIDRPTPRVLRRSNHFNLGTELQSSAAFSHRGLGVTSAGSAWKASAVAEGGGFDSTMGSVVGTTATTEQLVAAAADVGMVNILELRRELGRSVGQVKFLANAVKADVQEVMRMCPVNHPRAVVFLRRWACERLAILADEILLSRAAAALDRWRRATTAIMMAERKHAYLQYQRSNMLAIALHQACLRRVAKGWIRWSDLVVDGRAAERHALELSAAVTVQTVFRGLAARKRRARLSLAARDRQIYLAAVVITRCIKGKVARIRYARLKADFDRVHASEMLRRVGRGMLGRRKARRLKEQQAKLKVALGVQQLFRGRQGRRIFLAITIAKRERLAATRIQAVTRGKWGKQQAERVRQRIREDASAECIQRVARAWLARRLVRRIREEAIKTKAIRTAATLNIQRVYRGHRSRVLHGARLEIQRSLQNKENSAATNIQALVRAHLSKRVVSKMSRKRKEERTENARLWVETWSEDAQAWFYYNAVTGEALWQPPRTGYTKHDGKLVLTSGEVLEDPLSGLTEEERSEARKQSACVECEDKRATRKCEQCGDGYCTRCFRKTHASGRRTKHTWKHVGPMECAECEAEVAIKWCTACDDPFCGPCWGNIHSRGKRSKHSHCTISPGGRVAAKATAADGTDAGPFTPGESLRAETMGGGGGVDQAYSGAPMVEGDSAGTDWQEYADDNGIPYWHSSSTGVSQYENPFLPQAATTSWTGGSIMTAATSEGGGGAGAWNGGQWDCAQQGGFGPIVADGSTGQWAEYFDDDGRAYYYNAVTGESQYESPY